MTSVHKLELAALALPVTHFPLSNSGKGTTPHRLALKVFLSQHSSVT